MRYSYNKIGGIISGVNFHFENGDDKIALELFEFIETSVKLPTSIAWNGERITPVEVLHQLRTLGIGEDDWLEIRLMIDDLSLLKEYLELFKENYPALSPMVAEIKKHLFMTKN